METSRPPIVTILGHVDHGKTTLLDFIRKSNVVSREHGGITQHIGAYQITHNSKLLTFIDTPGHAAFEKMRSRGAKVADIAVLVVAADDGVMPQTTEAIKHILEAKVPMIVAVNKIDLPGIDLAVQLQKIKKQLSDQKVDLEEYGGEVPLISLSAKTGAGVDQLLEMIQLVAQLHEFKGDDTIAPAAVVIESSMDKFKGPVATLLVRNGTLKKGDEIIIDGVRGKIRSMFDFKSDPLEKAGPSTPVEILGLEAVLEVGSVLGSESANQPISEAALGKSLVDRLKQGETKTLKVVIKADKQGSLEAIEDSLNKFNSEKKLVEVISSATGEIFEKDVKVAASTGAVVIGFNVKVASSASKLAETERVLVRTYNIIYELLEEMEEVVEGLLKPGKVEEILGRAQVLAIFPHSQNEKIAGCQVLEGVITRGARIRINRADQVVAEGKISSLKKVREEISKAEKGSECGMLFDPQLDFQVGDIVESFKVIT